MKPQKNLSKDRKRTGFLGEILIRNFCNYLNFNKSIYTTFERNGLSITDHIYAKYCLIGQLINIFRILDRDEENSADILLDRKSTRLNSSHVAISYAVF